MRFSKALQVQKVIIELNVILGDPGADRGDGGWGLDRRGRVATGEGVVGREEPLGTGSCRTGSGQRGGSRF